MNDIVHQIPWQLSNFGGSGVGGSYNLQDYQFDYALGGIPFLSATRDAWPYTEGMAEIRKQQFDSFAEPGEQSISGNFWWLRSQSNFSGGAGIIYQDPDTDNQFDVRFADSLGVDPWTSGELKLLRQPDNRFTVTSSFTRTVGYVDPSGVDSAWYTDGGIFWKITSAGRTGITNPSAGTQFDLAGTGTRYFILASDGIWSGIDTAAATQMYTPPGGTLTSGAIAFVKGRIAAAFNNTIYFAPINTGGPIAIPTTSSFTHTDPNWVWTSITEGPTAIYAAGRNSTSSAIHKFTIDFSGTTEIVLPTITAVTPTGERINSIFGYIGSFMGIATTKGFRVGEFDSNGDVVYGPLLFTPTGGCQGITGFDRFMWTGSTAAHDGSSGLYRVDLGNTIQEQTTKAVRYAYARDLYASGQTNSIQSVTMLGASDRKVFTITSSSVWSENATTLYPTGYLKTGRIRFNTEEPKLYKFVSLRTPIPLQGGVGFSVIDKSGAETPYVTYGPSFSPGTGDIATPQPNGPQIWVALRFTLTRGTDITTGGVLNGWQYKALPGSIRQRLINQTFLLFDEEMDKGGQRVGTDGYARSRFEDFKALARAGDVVVFQELIEDISTLVVIDDWKYTQTGPPGPNASSLGGYLTVVLRTVAEST
jgi:hypothetical protein